MTTRWKAVLFPLGRVVLAVLLVGGAVAAAEFLVKALKGVLSLGGAAPAIYYAAYLIVSVLVAYFVYRTYVHLVEKRTVTELSGAGAPRELGAGMLLGFALVAAIVGMLWLLGCYRVTGVGLWTAAFVLLANNGAGAFVEEVLLRGIIFRISEERLGTWIALAILVGVEGGILPSAAYVLTRRLWLAIGIHFAWDFAQDYVFGTTSGATGLVRAELTGPALLSGGSSGLEGSILALLLCLIVSAFLLVMAGRKGHFMKLSQRRPTLTSASPSPR